MGFKNNQIAQACLSTLDSLKSIMTNTDSYKASMYKQYPPGTTIVYSYIESRGGKYDRTLFFGLQTFIKQYLMKLITREQIEFAAKVWEANGMPFNKEGWEYILETYGGKLPVKIRAVREGTVIPTKNVMCVIENTDPKCFWLTTWIETALLRGVWYPTTVATMSWDIKQTLREYLEMSGDVSGLPFKLHDFGARGVSSAESAELGGAAHLVNFMGTDTIAALVRLHIDYNAPLNSIGYSIPAAEHSTITSWGREFEVQAYRNMLKQFGKKDAILAVVSDSYDIYKACGLWGTELKEEVIASGATVVIRPDSGDPIEVLPKMLAILAKTFGTTTNAKGYRVLNYVRIIWGDGIDALALKSILRTVVDVCGFSADNFAFGMGGGLLQKLDRDTQKFAMKCSAALVNGVWIDVFKDPITDQGKSSKKGRVTLFKDAKGEYYTGVEDWNEDDLVDYFEDGELLIDQTLAEIRALSEA
jgi:nicotinamide phosphoribosyltransferase